jgi:hypothetical protein
MRVQVPISFLEREVRRGEHLRNFKGEAKARLWLLRFRKAGVASRMSICRRRKTRVPDWIVRCLKF